MKSRLSYLSHAMQAPSLAGGAAATRRDAVAAASSSSFLSAKNGHLALLEDIRHGWLALSRGSPNHHLHATAPMSSLANGFTFRLSNVSLLKMMKTSLASLNF